MSMFRKQQTVINDALCLQKTLEERGFKDVEVHETPVALTGSPIPGGDNTAEVIVRQKSNPNLYGDLGFKKQTDGTYSMCARMFVIRDNNKYIAPKEFLEPLTVAYNINRAKKIARKHGWEMLTTKQVDGKVTMQFKVNA